MRSRWTPIAVGLIVGLSFDAITALAWTGPTASAPNNNVAAPVNVGTTAQVKSGNLGVNTLTTFGNVQLDAAYTSAGTLSYLNFSNAVSPAVPTWGASGYGFRLNSSGRLEYNDSGSGTWTGFGSASGLWTAGSAGAIYYNGGNVGIGTATPSSPLDVNGEVRVSGSGDVGTDFAVTNTGKTAAGTAYTWRIYNMTGGYGNKLSFWAYANTNPCAGGLCQETLSLLDNGTVYVPYSLGIGTQNPSYKLDVRANVSGNYAAGFINSGTHGAVGTGSQYGLVGYNNGGNGVGVLGVGQCGSSACYGAEGSSGSYYGALGRADGYSYVGSGALYNSGTVYGTAFIYLSDIRLKHNVENLDQGIVTLMKLRPVTFTWNSHIKGANGETDPRSGKNDVGFIAQEVEKIIPGAIQTDPSTGYKAIDYPRLVPFIVKAMQQQEMTIENQQARIDDLEARIASIEAKLSQ